MLSKKEEKIYIKEIKEFRRIRDARKPQAMAQCGLLYQALTSEKLFKNSGVYASDTQFDLDQDNFLDPTFYSFNLAEEGKKYDYALGYFGRLGIGVSEDCQQAPVRLAFGGYEVCAIFPIRFDGRAAENLQYFLDEAKRLKLFSSGKIYSKFEDADRIGLRDPLEYMGITDIKLTEAVAVTICAAKCLRVSGERHKYLSFDVKALRALARSSSFAALSQSVEARVVSGMEQFCSSPLAPATPLARRAGQLDKGMAELEQLDQQVLGKSCTGPSNSLRENPRSAVNYGGCDCGVCTTKSAVLEKEQGLIRGAEGLVKDLKSTLPARAIAEPLRFAG